MSKMKESQPSYCVEIIGKPSMKAPGYIVSRVVIRQFGEDRDRYSQIEDVLGILAPWREGSEVRVMRPNEYDEFWKNYDPGQMIGGLQGGPAVYIDEKTFVDAN